MSLIFFLVRAFFRSHSPDPSFESFGDVPSAAIGIPLVAIPIFLALASVVFYVFWGLAVRGRDREHRQPHD